MGGYADLRRAAVAPAGGEAQRAGQRGRVVTGRVPGRALRLRRPARVAGGDRLGTMIEHQF